MFNQIVTASLRNRVFVLAASLLLIGIGGWLVPKLNIDVLPDLNRPTVNIQAESHGLAAEEVEQLVTFPIESAMQGIPGVTRVRSTSSPQPSSTAMPASRRAKASSPSRAELAATSCTRSPGRSGEG